MGFLAAAVTGFTLGASGNTNAQGMGALLAACLCFTALHVVGKSTVYRLFLGQMRRHPSAVLALLFGALSLLCNVTIAGISMAWGSVARFAWSLAMT